MQNPLIPQKKVNLYHPYDTEPAENITYRLAVRTSRGHDTVPMTEES